MKTYFFKAEFTLHNGQFIGGNTARIYRNGSCFYLEQLRTYFNSMEKVAAEYGRIASLPGAELKIRSWGEGRLTFEAKFFKVVWGD